MKKKLYLLLFSLFIFVPHDINALTLSEIRDEVRLRIKDSDPTRRRYSDNQLNMVITAASRDITTIGKPIVNDYEITLIAGTTYYSAADAGVTGMLDIKRVEFRNKALPETTQEELDSKNPSWKTAGGTPQYYFVDSNRITNIGFYPFPNSATSTGTVVVSYYQSIPDLLTSDSAEPLGADNTRFRPYHDIFVWRSCADILFSEGEIDKASYYQQLYENRLSYMKDNVWAKENYNPGFSGQRQ